jgi:hypothetical protein
LLLDQSLEEYCVRNPLPKSSGFEVGFRTCIVELVQVRTYEILNAGYLHADAVRDRDD